VLRLWKAEEPRSEPGAAAWIEVQVITPEGGPAAGATVVVDAPPSPRELRSDAAGHARIGPLPPRTNVQLHVTWEHAARHDRQLVLNAGTNRALVKPEAAAELTGSVADETGAALAGALLQARREPSPS